MASNVTNDQCGAKARRPLLDPIDRDSEFLFGIIMTLTFTCTLSVATAGDSEVRTVILSALACNVAWGVVDAMMYLLFCLGEREAYWRCAGCVLPPIQTRLRIPPMSAGDSG